MSSEKQIFALTQPHGSGELLFSWQPGSGIYLATAGGDQSVAIHNRNGKLVERIRLRGICCGLGWDSDGDLLAMISSEAPLIVLWDANTGRKHQVDSGLRDTLSCLLWSKTNPILAIGSTKGNLTIYNHSSVKRIPILGKHSKRIVCGGWSQEGLLALGSEDKSLSINNAEGDTLRIINLRAEPSHVQFSEMKLDERLGGENTVSVIVGHKTLFLYNLHDPDNPVELAFQNRYGSLITYRWFGDGYILLGFSAGYLVAISTHIREVGQELFQAKNHRDGLSDIALSTSLGQVASCGDNAVKVHDMSNLQDTVTVHTLDGEGNVEHVAWSEDGQLLAVSTRSGNLAVFLSCLPMLASVCGTKIAVLSSLNEVTLHSYNFEKGKSSSIVVPTVIEPSFVALGPFHLCVGMNNRVWFYDLTLLAQEAGTAPRLLKDKEYLGTINSMKLNADYASILHEGKLQLHMLESSEHGNENCETKLFPDSPSQDHNITCHFLTNDFLIYATDMGELNYFFMEDWKTVVEFRHSVGIRLIFPDLSGTKVILCDAKSEGYLFNPVRNDLIKVPEFPQSCIGVLWDIWPADKNVFIAYDDKTIVTYVYIPESVHGTIIERVGVTRLPANQVPLLLNSGVLVVQTVGGKLIQISLSTHTFQEGGSGVNTGMQPADIEVLLKKHLMLRRFKEAWKWCQLLNKRENWIMLGEAALKSLDINTALQVYRHIKNVAMVWALEEIRNIEERKLLAGHIALYLSLFDLAQEWYLASSDPGAALAMRRDLLQWEQALQLARNLAPHQVPLISKEYAQQLEFTGHYVEALSHYEKGFLNSPPNVSAQDSQLSEEAIQAHNAECRAGVTRTSIRCGDTRRGVAMALDPQSSKQLQKECAEILESQKQLNDAVNLFEKAELYERAASCYIQLKNWSKVGQLLPKISSPRIHLQFAKAKEADRQYYEASKAYEAAREWDSVIRINLDHLNNPEKAVRIVQETKSMEGAKMVAKFFQKLNDYESAIRFLVLSHCHDEAFQLARRHTQLELYGEILLEMRRDVSSGAEARPDDYRSLALHFENERNYFLAGKFYYHASDFSKALKLLLKVAEANQEDQQAIPLAIETVGAAKDERLATQLIEFLLGETDGVVRDAKYLFQLYMARQQFREAAKTALIIANDEQVNGNYRNAHDVLLTMYQELRQRSMHIPAEMVNNLMLLHSYILVRLHVRRGDHLKGSRMLVRVASNISRFPSHIVPIFTSAVIECHRAGLKSFAFTYAAMLMRPEYRSQVDPKYQKKIEAVVRKPPKRNKLGEIEEMEEPATPCPFCNTPLSETELNCSHCKNTIPFCIATGRHILRDDLTACPSCDFPAIRSELLQIIEGGENCPMCSEKINVDTLSLIRDPQPYLYPEGGEAILRGLEKLSTAA